MDEEAVVRLPLDDDPDLTALVDRFVSPGRRYLKLLHGNFLRLPAPERASFGEALRRDATRISDADLEVLLSSEWRSKLTAAWLLAASPRPDFVDRLGEHLVASQFVYAGQGYCMALASAGTEAAARQLSKYLARWLPALDHRYDQTWAMAALLHVDARLGTSHAVPFLGRGGPWETWAATPGELSAQVELTDRLLVTVHT